MSRPSKLPRVLAAIAQLEAKGELFSQADVELLALGKETRYLKQNRAAEAAYQEAIARLRPKPNQVCLPADLLRRLRDNQRFLEAGHGPSRDPEAMAEAAAFFGFEMQGPSGWNKTLDALDAYDPNWRGYAVPVRQAFLLHESARKVAA